MSTFVLIPGFWLGGWAWERVTPLLRAAGHDVHPVTLTGLGDRAHLARPDVDLGTHISDIVNTIEYSDLHDVVLVAHSGGGFPAHGATDRIPERLARVVYLDSGPMPDGTIYLDLVPEDRARIEQEVADNGDGWRIPVPAWNDPSTDPVNLADLGDTELAAMRARAVPQPFATATTPLKLTNPAAAAVPKALITTTSPLEQVRAMIDVGHPYFAEFGTNPLIRELPTGHWPMFSRPKELADLLDAEFTG
jgi:pimeloyl-ACP methyl ester carboxylesterase